MSFFDSIRIGASGAADTTYTVDRSLRFDPNDTYMERTPSSAGNRKTFTISLWFKLGIVKEYTGADGRTIFATGGGGSGSYATGLSLRADVYGGPLLEFTTMLGSASGANFGTLQTSAKIKDPAAWYHAVVKVDTTQSTSSNRIKMYINGVEQTDFSTESYPNQNADTYMNVADKTGIGANRTWANQNTKYNYFGGYLAEFHFLDGTAYDASYFGETDSATGQWNPKKYEGSYGTNGFYLKFADNSGTTATTLGKDSSGNGNNFTPYGFSVSAGAGNDSVEDTPTNNFPTFNPLCENNNHTYTEGNLKVTYAANNQSGNVTSMASPKTGKWYWEVRPLNNYLFIGVTAETYQGTGNVISATNTGGSTVAYYQDGQKYVGGSVSSYGAGFGSSDLIGVALDMDNGQVTFYKNNTSQGAISLVSTEGHLGVGAVGTGQSLSMSINFGQQAFTYTPPTGFKKLCSANLPDPTILLPNKHFDTLLWNGNSTKDTDIAGLNFSPDWVWIKSRSHSVYAGSLKYNHVVWDTLRGVGLDTAASTSRKELTINETYAEGNATNLSNYYGHVSAFNSDGFELDHITGQPAFLTNMSGRTYVGWNWNAGETDGKTYAVTVVSDSGNKYRFDGFGTSAVTLDLAEGGTYIFDQSDSSNAGHPLRFSTTSNGTHGGGSEYTTGVTTAGTPGSSGAYTQIVVAASAPTLYYYCSVHSGMGGQINTNTTLGSSNFDGTIQSTVKANTTAGFSVVTYTGNHTSGATVGHGLGATPSSVIVKARGTINGQNRGWNVYHVALGNTKYVQLSSNATPVTNSAWWNNTTPNSTTFTLGNDYDVNANISGGNYVAYVFSEVAGYSKFGSYTGNGNADGPFVFTGFRPAWIMIKMTGYTGHWIIFDNKRDPFNYCDSRLFPNLVNAEDSNYNVISMLSNGFKFENQYDGSWNRNNTQFIYYAFAESPFKNARAR